MVNHLLVITRKPPRNATTRRLYSYLLLIFIRKDFDQLKHEGYGSNADHDNLIRTHNDHLPFLCPAGVPPRKNSLSAIDYIWGLKQVQ